MNDVQKLFGSLVFNETVMKDRLPTVTYKAYKQAIIEGKPLNLEIANIIANAMKDWALEHGCTHFTHWFQPMTLDYSELDSFVILIGLKGEAKITDNEGNEITLQGGESIVVPASTQTLKVEGTLKFLETYV